MTDSRISELETTRDVEPEAPGSGSPMVPSREKVSTKRSEEGSRISETRHNAQQVLKRLGIVVLYVAALLVCLVLALLYGAIVLPYKRVRKWLARSREEEALTDDWWGLHDGDNDSARAKRRPANVDLRRGVDLQHCYITTRDGTKLATDIWIPSEALRRNGGSLPVIFHQARYYRSATLRWPFSLIVNGGKPINFVNDPFFKSFLSHGMILVSVDVRGTGASFGAHLGPWSPEEQEDSMEVLDWIERQPWSNGKVGLWGLSYEGTSAFFTSLLRHPTVVCCCPMFFFWDVFDDLSHPGGVPMKHFSREWQMFNDSLDSGWVQSTGFMARFFLEGVTPVNPGDPWGYKVKLALEEHKDNWSLLKDSHIRYMDDTSKRTGREVKCACVSQIVHELLAKQGITEGSPPLPSAGKTLSTWLPGAGVGTERTLSFQPAGSSGEEGDVGEDGQERERTPLVGSNEVRSAGERKSETTWSDGSTAMERFPRTDDMGMDDVTVKDDDVVVEDGVVVEGDGVVDADKVMAEMEAEDERAPLLPCDPTTSGAHATESGAKVAEKGVGEGSTSVVEGPLEETLPYYFHVSGWLDASAHAAVMAFMTLPCRGAEMLVGPWNHGGHQHVRPHHISSRSRFDFCTEVTGFLVRRLSALSPHGPHTNGDSRPGEAGVAVEGDEKKGGCVGPEGCPWAGTKPGSHHRNESRERPSTPACPENFGVRPLGKVIGDDVTCLSSSDNPTAVDAVAASAAETAEAVTSTTGAEHEALPEAARVIVEGEQEAAAAELWMRARPRVRFYTHQEERWHEANTFPSTPSNKMDIVLSLGKQRLQKPALTAGNTSTSTATATATPRKMAALARDARSFTPSTVNISRSVGVARGADLVSLRRSEGSWNPFATERHSSILRDREGTLGIGENQGSPDDTLVDCDTPTSSGEGGRHASVIVEAGGAEGNRPESGEEGENEDSMEFHEAWDKGGVGLGLGGPNEAKDSSGDLRGSGVKDRLSVRLAKWQRSRKPKLALSQDPQEEEDCHELVVDVENDHDGEGVSRWVAMTELWSFISYKMDGLRSNHLRFTSPPLKQDMEVTGYPIVSLWISAADDLPNLDVFAYLQAVRPRTARSIYVTEGCFRAEHRKEANRRHPLDVRALPGVPIHSQASTLTSFDSYLRVDSQPLEKGRPVELKFKLMPTSFRFLKGQRVRLSIGGADARHFHPIDLTPVHSNRQGSGPDASSPTTDGTPTESAAKVTRRVLRVHTGGVYASSVSLPVPLSEAEGDDRGEGGARTNVATRRTDSIARALWARAKAGRQRSLSTPDVLGTVARQEVVGGPLREGRWALTERAERGRSEVWSHNLDVDREDSSSIFVE